MSSDIKETISSEALRIVTGARRSAYGRPEQNFQRIADFWMTYFRAKGWKILTTEDVGDGPARVQLQPLDVAAMMRLMKEARLTETPDHYDSYLDLVGYSLCGAEVAGVLDPTAAQQAKPDPNARHLAEKELAANRDAAVAGRWSRAVDNASVLDATIDAHNDVWRQNKAEPKFKVGDRVRRTVASKWRNAYGGAGTTGVITRATDSTIDIIDETGKQFNNCSVSLGQFELVEPKPFQIEAGKYYRTRGGLPKGPILIDLSCKWPAFVLVDADQSRSENEWRLDGSWSSLGIEDPNDLVAEWVD